MKHIDLTVFSDEDLDLMNDQIGFDERNPDVQKGPMQTFLQPAPQGHEHGDAVNARQWKIERIRDTLEKAGYLRLMVAPGSIVGIHTGLADDVWRNGGFIAVRDKQIQKGEAELQVQAAQLEGVVIAKEANEISREANRISKEASDAAQSANQIAKKANRISESASKWSRLAILLSILLWLGTTVLTLWLHYN